MPGKPRGDHALSNAERSAALRARKKARDRLRDEALITAQAAAEHCLWAEFPSRGDGKMVRVGFRTEKERDDWIAAREIAAKEREAR
jgi:hypothetical protein